MTDTEAQACVTPLSDLRRGALEHYERLSMAACDWHSAIPRAINFYFDAEEAKSRPVSPEAAPPRATTPEPMTDERLAEIRRHQNNFLHDYWGAYIRELVAEVDRLRATLASSPSEAGTQALHAAASDLRHVGSGGTVVPETLQAHADALLRGAPSGAGGDTDIGALRQEAEGYLSTSTDLRATNLVLALLDTLTTTQRDAEAYHRINTPEIGDFLSAVQNEALHQRERWGVDADGGKTDADWFWLVGYLAGKALHDVKGKRLHHIITSAAALLNWHAHAMGAYARLRPGIADPDAALAPARGDGETLTPEEPTHG